jgi:hypothetical protein
MESLEKSDYVKALKKPNASPIFYKNTIQKRDSNKRYYYLNAIGNSLEIDDCDIQVVRSRGRLEGSPDDGKYFKERIITDKSIWVNNYTIFVMDVTSNEFLTIWKHISP